MSHTFEASCCSPAFRRYTELDDDKVSTTLAEFFSTSWEKAREGDVNAAVVLQHYADHANAHKTQEGMMHMILEKMDPTPAMKLRQAIISGSVISFE